MIGKPNARKIKRKFKRNVIIGEPAALHLISFTASLVLSKLLEAQRRIGLTIFNKGESQLLSL